MPHEEMEGVRVTGHHRPKPLGKNQLFIFDYGNIRFVYVMFRNLGSKHESSSIKWSYHPYLVDLKASTHATAIE